MEKFCFIQFPEQIFNLRQKADGRIPVLPIFSDLNFFNRIFSFIKKQKWPTALFYEKSACSFSRFLEYASLFDSIFTFDSKVVKSLREENFSGKIYLFSNFKTLSYPNFFNRFNASPVAAGKSDYELAKRGDLEPLYFVTDKACVAEFGRCISRKGVPQFCFNCDNRCREQSRAKAGLDFPVSIRPDLTVPKGVSYFAFTEKALFPLIKEGEIREQILEKSWNYPYPLGFEILKFGKPIKERSFFFVLDKRASRLFDKGLLEFYAFTGSVYKSRRIESPKIKRVGENKLLLENPTGYNSVLMASPRDERERDFLKKAKHFIYTLPEREILKPPLFESNEVEILKSPQPTNGEKRVKRGEGRYSKRVKLTLISDNVKKFAVFRGKNRSVERKVLLYERGISKNFADYIYIAGTVSEKDFQEIEKMAKLKGIVVDDDVMREAFQSALPDKEILLHPLSCFDSKDSPFYLSASTTIFVSKFKSEKRNDYSWPDVNIFLKNRVGYAEFVSRKKMVRLGQKKEIWVDAVDVAERALLYLKAQLDLMISSIK